MAGPAFARTAALLLIATATSALAGEPSNPVCHADVHRAGNFDLRQIGPLIAGTWTEAAIGTSVAIGVQESTFEIIYDRNRNRLYLGSDGIQTELVPVRGGNKPLRFDFVRGEPMDPQFYMFADTPRVILCARPLQSSLGGRSHRPLWICLEDLVRCDRV